MRLLRIDIRTETKPTLISEPKPGEEVWDLSREGLCPISHRCIWRDSALCSCDGAIRAGWLGQREGLR